MAEGKFEGIVLGLILIGLVAFLGMSWAFSMANEYGKDVTTFEANSINFGDLNQSLSEAQSKGEGWFEIAQKRGVFLAFAGLVLIGFFDIGISMLNFAKTFFDLIFIQLFNNVLHVPPVVTGIVIIMLIIGMLIGLWRLIKIGE